jgi:hypothetical protein
MRHPAVNSGPPDNRGRDLLFPPRQNHKEEHRSDVYNAQA